MPAPSVPPWLVDPDDPRAPPREIWARLTPAERAEVVASLPSDFPVSEASPPEGDDHVDAWTGARQTLRRWFKKRGRGVYVGGNLPVYYPGEAMFSPDVIAVLDVDPHPRDSWIVSNEGDRGLDFAIEVIVSGRRRKDLRENPERYARLGIPEYFVFDVRRLHLGGYRLPRSGGARYERLIPQAGLLASEVLGLELSIEQGRLRFSLAGAPVPELEEVVGRLESLIGAATEREARLEAALEEEQQRREEEQRRREEAEHQLAAITAELERLRRER